jgi:hypothetical protein
MDSPELIIQDATPLPPASPLPRPYCLALGPVKGYSSWRGHPALASRGRPALDGMARRKDKRGSKRSPSRKRRRSGHWGFECGIRFEFPERHRAAAVQSRWCAMHTLHDSCGAPAVTGWARSRRISASAMPRCPRPVAEWSGDSTKIASSAARSKPPPKPIPYNSRCDPAARLDVAYCRLANRSNGDTIPVWSRAAKSGRNLPLCEVADSCFCRTPSSR